MRSPAATHDKPLHKCGRAKLLLLANEAKTKKVRKVPLLSQAKEQKVIKTRFHHINDLDILKMLLYEFILLARK